MPKDLLLEIGTEPLPARFVKPALDQLFEKTQAALRESRLAFQGARAYGTLRRLAVLVEGVEEKSQALTQEIYGPPASKLKDESGAFSVMATGFAHKYGLEPSSLTTVTTAKGEQLAARKTIPAEPALKILSRVLPRVIAALEFPKSLEWEESRFRFGRPIRSLTALYGRTVVPFQAAGVRTGKGVGGLAAQGPKPVPLSEAGRYRMALKNLSVLADVGERREVLTKRLEEKAKEAAGRLDLDLALLEETVFMTEHPVPVVGRFRKEFLALPAPLLSLVLKKQLKFFPLYDGRELKAAFIGVRDGISEGQKLVREGYERVLEARFDDAAFFFGRDKASRLEAKLPRLERVTYQKDLGTMAQKAVRVQRLSAWLCEKVRQDQPVNEEAVAMVAKLCYADLVTEVVKEFPELQGTMGGVYARVDGYDERVALGLEQFHFPVAAKSPVPTFPEGALVSLAGKIDSLAGSFAVGVVPTGSADPYALRRQALGVVRILLEKQLRIDLEALLGAALELQPATPEIGIFKKVGAELSDFIWARAQSLFEDLGFKADEIRSVREGGLRNLPRTLLRLSAVRNVRKNPDFEPLAAAFKRAANILKQAKVAPQDKATPERELLKEEAELSLYDVLTTMEGQVHEKLYNNDFEAGLRTLVGVKPHLDRFFEDVMVMAEDPELRRQRLSLLAKLVRLFNSVADLSELQSPSAN